MIKKFINNWPIVLLLVLTFLLRVYKIEDFFYFSYDESIPAFVGRNLILWQHIPLIGGVTPFGFHLAPYFYWFLATILFLGRLNPIVWGWIGALIAVVTTFLIYIVGKEFFSKKTGFIAASFWTFSYLTNLYDRHLWALYWGPLVSLVTLYSLNKIINGKYKYVYLLSMTFALAIHADLSNLLFVALSAIAWFLYKIPVRKELLFALAIIALSFIPLVAFDLRHNFANIKPAIQYFEGGRNHPANNPQDLVANTLLFPRTFTRLIYTFTDREIAKNYSYCPIYANEKYQQVPKYAVAAASILILGFLIYSHGKPRRYKIMTLLILLYYFSIQLFGTLFKSDIFEHYLTGLFPVFIIIIAIFIGKLPRPLCLIALGIFISANLYKLSVSQNSLGLKYKREAIQYVTNQIGDKPFSLDSLSTCWKYSGYRYLFAVFGREPVKSYVDPNFAHLYGTTGVAKNHPPTVVSFVFHDFQKDTNAFYERYTMLKNHSISSALFGRIEVVILDNSSGWFDKRN